MLTNRIVTTSVLPHPRKTQTMSVVSSTSSNFVPPRSSSVTKRSTINPRPSLRPAIMGATPSTSRMRVSPRERRKSKIRKRKRGKRKMRDLGRNPGRGTIHNLAGSVTIHLEAVLILRNNSQMLIRQRVVCIRVRIPRITR